MGILFFSPPSQLPPNIEQVKSPPLHDIQPIAGARQTHDVSSLTHNLETCLLGHPQPVPPILTSRLAIQSTCTTWKTEHHCVFRNTGHLSPCALIKRRKRRENRRRLGLTSACCLGPHKTKNSSRHHQTGSSPKFLPAVGPSVRYQLPPSIHRSAQVHRSIPTPSLLPDCTDCPLQHPENPSFNQSIRSIPSRRDSTAVPIIARAHSLHHSIGVLPILSRYAISNTRPIPATRARNRSASSLKPSLCIKL
ncbi:hypothetical protein F5Y08DRAFT_40635 [Xylaria arbuscula]|nr:hypothetical protein F5Y08DRAFT_40635 [Xylaria arbuscula]